MAGQRTGNWNGAFIASILAIGVAYAGSTALACGYHNPSAVARGAMNYVYPKSLYVRTAVWQAQLSGLLPPREARAARDLFAFQRMAATLETWGDKLDVPGSQDLTFTVVLLDSMLWTRYVWDDGSVRVAVHAKGAKKDDLVLVTEGAVMRALNDGSLRFEQAIARGLIRLYGPEEKQQALRETLKASAREHRQAEPHSPSADWAG